MTIQQFYDKWKKEMENCKMTQDFLEMIQSCLIDCSKDCYHCEKYKPINDIDREPCNMTNDKVNPITWIKIKENNDKF